MQQKQATIPDTSQEAWLLAQLKASARSFYLTLRLLPASIRFPIGLAYLLARIGDTLADHTLWKADKRLAYMTAYRHYLLSGGPIPDIASTEIEQLDRADKSIVQGIEQAHQLLHHLGPQDATLVKKVVDTLTSGMKKDLEFFHAEDKVTALNSEKDLEEYTYLVAGCVGEFWTDISIQHISELSSWPRDEMVDRGVRFGKALQLTNILRDVTKDHALGRCYIPQQMLEDFSSSPEALITRLGPNEHQLIAQLIEKCLHDYDNAIDYTLNIPPKLFRLRVACTLPILIGLKTIALLRLDIVSSNRLNPVKISRREVYKVMLSTILAASSNKRLESLLRRFRANA